MGRPQKTKNVEADEDLRYDKRNEKICFLERYP